MLATENFHKNCMELISYRNKWRDDCVNGLFNHLETVLIILTKKMGSHECENRHDVVKNTVLIKGDYWRE